MAIMFAFQRHPSDRGTLHLKNLIIRPGRSCRRARKIHATTRQIVWKMWSNAKIRKLAWN